MKSFSSFCFISLSLSLCASVRFIRHAAFEQLLISALAGLMLDLKQFILRRDSLFMPIYMIHSLFMPINMITQFIYAHSYDTQLIYAH